MKPAERFDSEATKTKAIFVTVQLLYTAATLLLAFGLWSSFRAHLAYLLSILACCIWNGGSYYIEVFSKAYRKQFEGDAVTRPDGQAELPEANAEGEGGGGSDVAADNEGQRVSGAGIKEE